MELQEIKDGLCRAAGAFIIMEKSNFCATQHFAVCAPYFPAPRTQMIIYHSSHKKQTA